ncbi:MAG: sensor histidine kinase, partial [Fibrobacterota bacterium]
EHQMRTETLASIGIMVAGIAHEINNPLSGISGISGNMIKMPQRYGLNNKGISRIEAVYESANRAESIMKDLLNLSRKKEYAVRSVNLRELVDQALSSVHFEGYRTVNKTITGEEMVLAYCDPEKIRQVLINLINNAAYAVLSRREEFPDETYEPSIKINIGKKSKAAVISIIDNGSGIETDYLKKIFDPFFTTKEPGQGTGLGLSICNKIITEHKGSLNVDSTPGRTEFIIELPLRKGRNYSEKNTDS